MRTPTEYALSVIEMIESGQSKTMIAKKFGVTKAAIFGLVKRWRPDLITARNAEDSKNRLDKFWRNVDRRGESDCWNWLLGRDKDGYGCWQLNGKSARAHRIAYQLANDIVLPVSAAGTNIPNHVCHRCDNPPCCNPKHLFLGTSLDNRRDCVQKGRQCKGSTHRNSLYPELVTRGDLHGRVVLKERQIPGIWSRLLLQETAVDIAREYNVPAHIIRDIRSGRTWHHVTLTMPELPRDQRKSA